ncbi:UPF0194 membrane protein YbhG [Microbulbifer aestuariivivens]|uniref:UPF0194 membrane protein YbhG n=1 Tax=Microbulbifer aestuariivivens TaxID=1908308 RepID=A0ABP9WS46_9GAMM
MESKHACGIPHGALAGLRALIMVGLGLVAACSGESYLEGRVEMRELNIATKYPGRIARLYVEEGQRVQKGQLLAEISDPEAEARMTQADAGVVGAGAEQAVVDDGARIEQRRAAKANMQAAEAQARLARVTAQRMQRLFSEGVVPRQRLDEALAAEESTASIYHAARSEYDLVLAGARPQNKTAAASVTRAAEGARQLVQAALTESRVIALADGEITSINFHEGEIIAPGVPIAILARVDRPWISFNLREDLLQGLQVGQRLTAKIPALGQAGESVQLQVFRIAVLGDYGTWQSTRALGSYDLRSFEVRARPVQPVSGLRAGMSVLVPMSDLGRGDDPAG